MEGDAEARFSMRSQRRPRSFQGNPDPPAAARLCTSLDDGNLPPERWRLLLAAMTWIVAGAYVVDPEWSYPRHLCHVLAGLRPVKVRRVPGQHDNRPWR